MSVRVAFSTTEGTIVDEHFGHALYWDIYDIGEEAEFVETRKVKAQCSCHDPKIFDIMLSSLNDCSVLFTAKIGESAAAYVIRKGKRVFEAAGDLYAITKEFVDKHLLDSLDDSKNKQNEEIRRAS